MTVDFWAIMRKTMCDHGLGHLAEAGERKRSEFDASLARFADGTATRTDIEVVSRSSLSIVQIHVRRHKPPGHGKPIRLLGKSGPFSAEDRPVEHVSGLRWGRGPGNGGLWSAWWRPADLRFWLRNTRP